jgi:hypothetical protein
VKQALENTTIYIIIAQIIIQRHTVLIKTKAINRQEPKDTKVMFTTLKKKIERWQREHYLI